VDGTGCGLCPMAGFGISGVEPLGSGAVVRYQGNMLWGWEVEGTGSELCPLAGFGIRKIEPLWVLLQEV